MYDFHYNFIKKKFDAELQFTYMLQYMFDFSNYSKDSKFFDDTNKKVIGKMKDEYG